jgi:hypothetical protein
MNEPNTTRQTRNVSALAALGATSKAHGDGLVGLAILSLAGLALSVILIAQGFFADALSLMVAQ